VEKSETVFPKKLAFCGDGGADCEVILRTVEGKGRGEAEKASG
jgi:hypothetical protein